MGLQLYMRKEQERIVKIDIFRALNYTLQMNSPTLHALIANGLSLASCVKPFDLFPMAGVGCLDDMSNQI